jgi:hypothetical protein
MFCANCGRKLEGGKNFCAGCGKPVSGSVPQKYTMPGPPANMFPQNVTAYQQPAPLQQQINIHIPQQPAEHTTKWQTPRIVIGIITIVLFFLLQFQSCAAGIGESLQSLFSEEAGTSGITGYMCSFFFLIAGIVSIACRKSKGGSIVAGSIYALCGLVLINESFSYFQDLAFYCFLSFVFGGIMIISGALQNAR